MKQPSHSDPDNRIDHPLTHNQSHAWDVYLNPWWALRFMNGPAEQLALAMTRELGKPTLLDDPSWVNRLVWWHGGNRVGWLMANLSGGNGSIWFDFQMPWSRFSFKDLQAGWHPEALGHSLNDLPLEWHLEQLRKFVGGTLRATPPTVMPDFRELFKKIPLTHNGSRRFVPTSFIPEEEIVP